jgi:class 3 adenylate cyclase/DNA-binding CsgD family transcriptional regulator
MGRRSPSTRTVSLLFTDLVASTALANEVGAERAGALVRDHLQTLDRLIERAGGQSVKSLGDGVMAVFGSARQAIDCAVSMQRMMHATAGQQRRPMAMRIGIGCGDASLDGDDYHGRPVVEAARLCAAARGGQILATEVTGRMTSGLVGVEIRPPVPIELKGIDEPVAVVEVAWEAAVGGGSIGLKAADQPLLEREREIDVLADAVAAARAGRGALVLIEGPAGIGKTRLLACGADAGTTSGMLVLRAHGAELEQDYSWGVVRQLFERWLFDQAPVERDRLLVGAAEPALAALGRGGSASDRDPFAIVHGLYWLVVNAADGAPVALVVDDAQWADEASLRWLTYLAHRAQQLPLALIIAVRRPDPAADREPLRRLQAERSAQVLHPLPLSPDATGELVAQRPRLAHRPELALACHAASGGNPFLLGALLDDLSEQAIGGLPDPDGVRALRPAQITRSVLLRLGRLSAEARSLARAFAILGGSATTARAAMLVGVEAPVAVNQISALVTAGIFRDSAPPAFAHPVIHTVVLEDMPAAERAGLHAQAAALLRASGAAIQEVAAQLLQAEPAADSAVVQILCEAARAALADGAPEAAAALLQRAVREPPPVSESHAVQRLLGRALIRARGAAGLAPLRAAVEAAPDPRTRGNAAIELAAALEGLSRNTEATDVYVEALRDLPPAEERLVDGLEAGLAVAASQHLSTLPRALEAFAAMMSRQPAGGAPSAVMQAVMALAAAAAGNPEAVAMARAALADGELFEADTSVAIGLAVTPLVWADHLDEALSAWNQVIERARRHGAPLRFAFGITFRAQVYLRSGRLVDAEADARAALEIPDAMWVASVPVDTVALLAEALIDRGELDEAESLLAPAGPAGELSDYQGNNLLLMARGRLRLTQGRATEAAEDLIELGRRCEAWTLRNPAAFPWRSHAALALSLHDRERAIALAEEEIELAAAFGAPRALGISLRAAGLVQHGSTGLERLRDAVHVHQSSPAVLERARTLIALGSAERRAGERSRARRTLTEGLDMAAACGAHVLVEQARGELAAAGARPRRDRITGRDALTASELRVARMATEGKTNREIAETLWVTLSTVETHLTRVYRKLDIAERSELEQALQSAVTPEPAGSTSRSRPVANQGRRRGKGTP